MADILRKTGSALTFIETPQNTQVSFSKGNLIVEDDGDVYYDPTTGSSIENRIKLKGALDGDGGEIKSDLTLVAPAVIHQAAEPTADDVLVNKGYLDNQLQGVVHIENEEIITGKKTFKNQEGINLVNYKGTKYNTANCKLSTQLADGYGDTTASPADIDSNLYINNKAVATEEYVTDNYVKQVAGKGLSTNDFDNTAKNQLETAYTYSQADHAPTDAEKNVIVGIQQNGKDLVVDSTTRKVNINTPIPGTTYPLMDGTANQGSRAGYAREDHRHPTDTTRATDNEVVHLAGNEKITGLKIFTEGMKLPAGNDSIILTGGVSAETLESYLAVNGKLLPTIDYTNGHYALKADITGVYKAKGNLVSANLNASLLTANSLGWVYNITDEFTINENFLEYDASNPKTYPAGTNVVIVQATPSTYKFDVLSGFIDTSTFASNADVVHIAGDETITGVKNFAARPTLSSGGIRWDAGSTGLGYVAKLHSLSDTSPVLDFISDDENKVAVSFSLRNTVTDGGGNNTYTYGIKSGLSGNEWLATENYVDNKISSSVIKNLLDGTAVGSLRSIGSIAEDSTYALGEYSLAEGQDTKASGIASHAEGAGTEAAGRFAHAEGVGTHAIGEASHAEGGEATVASGVCSHAEGEATVASGVCSHAEGQVTTASGVCSHAEGEYTQAKARCQHVQGRYNILDGTDNQDEYGTYVHIVGNGTSGNARSNAHTLDWSGNAWFAGDVQSGTGGKLSEKTDKSTSVSITLTSTNWSSGIYTYTNSAITATNIIELYPASTITSTQFEALQSANIIGGTQSAGSIQLKAMGDVPTIDIPIVLTIRQDT